MDKQNMSKVNNEFWGKSIHKITEVSMKASILDREKNESKNRNKINGMVITSSNLLFRVSENYHEIKISKAQKLSGSK